MVTDTTFRVYELVNEDSVIGYSYVGVDKVNNRAVFIDEDHIQIDEIHDNDRETFNEDYKATERFFVFDIAFLNDIILSYFGRSDFSLTGYFNKDKEVTITFGMAESYQEVDLSTKTHTTCAGKEITIVIHRLLDSIKEQFFK